MYCPEIINLQKIRRKAEQKCFPLCLVHFFVAGENETFYTDSGNTVSVTGTSRRKFGAFKK